MLNKKQLSTFEKYSVSKEENYILKYIFFVFNNTV